MTAPLPDFGCYASAPAIVEVAREATTLLVTWSDKMVAPFQLEWLRHNCPCDECVDPLTREHKLLITEFPADVEPRAMEVSPGGELQIRWSHEGHESAYHPGWLRAHAGPPAEAREQVLWDADLSDRLPRFACGDVMSSDTVLLDWLRALRSRGVAILDGGPVDTGFLPRLVARIGLIRTTSFGGVFDVCPQSTANSIAYTSLRVPPHTDLPSRELQPGLQFLHCIRNDVTEGGGTYLLDGFRVASVLREQAPELFDVLCRMPVTFRSRDRRTEYVYRGPILRIEAGRVAEIRFANQVRGAFRLPAGQMPALYRAYRRFAELTESDELRVRVELTPGQVLVFDNRRILHGREAFREDEGGRLLQGCYVDRDELLSRIRILERAAPPATLGSSGDRD